MSAKLGFTAGLAVGLLAGSRAGRGLYDRSAATATAVANDPRVRRVASTALHKAGAAGSSVAGAAGRKIAERRGAGDEHDGDEGRGDGAADGAADGAGPASADADDDREHAGRRSGRGHHGRGLAGHSGDVGGRRRRGRGRGRRREKGHEATHFGHGAGQAAGGNLDGFAHRAWHRRHEEIDGMTPSPGTSRGIDGHPGISAPSTQEAGRVSGESGEEQ